MARRTRRAQGMTEMVVPQEGSAVRIRKVAAEGATDRIQLLVPSGVSELDLLRGLERLHAAVQLRYDLVGDAPRPTAPAPGAKISRQMAARAHRVEMGEGSPLFRPPPKSRSRNSLLQHAERRGYSSSEPVIRVSIRTTEK